MTSQGAGLKWESAIPRKITWKTLCNNATHTNQVHNPLDLCPITDTDKSHAMGDE